MHRNQKTIKISVKPNCYEKLDNIALWVDRIWNDCVQKNKLLTDFLLDEYSDERKNPYPVSELLVTSVYNYYLIYSNENFLPHKPNTLIPFDLISIETLGDFIDQKPYLNFEGIKIKVFEPNRLPNQNDGGHFLKDEKDQWHVYIKTVDLKI